MIGDDGQQQQQQQLSTISLLSYLIVIYFVVFWFVFIVVVVYRFCSNFIHLTSCLDHIYQCHVERSSSAQDKLGKYATITIGSGKYDGTRNSTIVGLLYTRVRVYMDLFFCVDV